jgi:hypothetical protein
MMGRLYVESTPATRGEVVESEPVEVVEETPTPEPEPEPEPEPDGEAEAETVQEPAPGPKPARAATRKN